MQKLMEFVIDESISIQSRIEKIKELVNLWRTIAITLGAGYLAILVPWSNYLFSNMHIFDPFEKEQLLISNGVFVEIYLLSIYIYIYY